MAAKHQRGKQTATKKAAGRRGGRAKKKQAAALDRAWSILLFGLGAVLLALSLLKGADAWNMVAGWLFGLFGLAFYILGPLVLYLALLVARGEGRAPRFWQAGGLLCLASAVCLVFSRLELPQEGFLETLKALAVAGQGRRGGGLASALLGWPLLALCGRPVARVVAVVLTAVFLMLLAKLTPLEVFAFLQDRARGAKTHWNAYEEQAAASRAAREERRQKQAAERAARAGAQLPGGHAAIDIPLGDPDTVLPQEEGDALQDYGSAPPPPGVNLSAPFAGGAAAAKGGRAGAERDAAGPGQAGRAGPGEQPGQDQPPDLPGTRLAFYDPAGRQGAAAEKAAQPPWAPPAAAPDPFGRTGPAGTAGQKGGQGQPDGPGAGGAAGFGPAAGSAAAQGEGGGYCYPPLALFEQGAAGTGGADQAELRRNADLLVNTLASFGVQTRLLDISRGPSVTRYELQPAAGVKISRITGLADDIALNLAAAGVRIEAPIPGKAAVGIEVPNKHASPVGMYSVLSDDAYKKNGGAILIPLGKDIAGAVQVADLARMPHLLIAGSTGSGKSVCINSIIISIIYRSSPQEVKLILIDPKVVELSDYNGIPHLLMPVVTEPRKASGALGSAVAEMERRYQLFAAHNVREIKAYNRLAGTQPELGLEQLPYIAIVIDELADLMMVAGKEVEDYICRLAQKARAAGMHLIVATQRPSVDVITGLIKANIPSRVAFAVSSQIDSRTILDGAGAEKLLGMGDMLFLPVGANKPVRIQGTYVKDSEINAVLEYVKQGAGAQYDDAMIEEMERFAADTGKGGGEAAAGAEGQDPMLQAAIETVVEAGIASTSLLQRRLKLGYARAARMMDAMEELHVIGPYEGSKPRTVLINRQQFIEMFTNSPPPAEEG